MKDHEGLELTRREFLIAGTAAAAVTLVSPDAQAETKANEPTALIPVTLQVNGQAHNLHLDPRTSLLDALREHLHTPAPRRAATMASAVPAPCWLADGGSTHA